MPPYPAFRVSALLVAAIGLPWISASSHAADIPAAGKGQLGQPLTWMPLPEDPDRFLAIQSTLDGRLYLTPNESFFPRLGLTAEGEGKVPDLESLNGDNRFASIGKWDPEDRAEWGIWLTKAGDLEATLHLQGGASSSRFELEVGDRLERFTIPAKQKWEKTLTFPIASPGMKTIRLTCTEGGRGVSFSHLVLTGAAAENSGVLRKRWRPAAAHTKFTSSSASEPIRLWVMEMDAVPGELNFYCPITTPFGYYGPTWQADGTVNSGFNFSLWSFGRGKPEPPVEQLSHLLAIGHTEATFGGFDHEGTGVKIRNWEPIEGRQGQRQVLALRVEPGPHYDTYYSYFFASDEARWRLFGVGNKWNGGKPLKSLWVGSFVEVPGPPPVQRTGAWERRMRYRGWVMDEAGDWHTLDRMALGNVNSDTGLTHTDRGVSEEGWFYLQTGGWYFRKAESGKEVELPKPIPPAQVPYLNPEAIAFLTGVPSEITATKLERADSRARITFTVRNAGKAPRVSVFWGPEEGLTLAEKWQNRTEIEAPIRDGENQVILEEVPEDHPVSVRLLLTGESGQFWSSETLSAAP